MIGNFIILVCRWLVVVWLNIYNIVVLNLGLFIKVNNFLCYIFFLGGELLVLSSDDVCLFVVYWIKS